MMMPTNNGKIVVKNNTPNIRKAFQKIKMHHDGGQRSQANENEALTTKLNNLMVRFSQMKTVSDTHIQDNDLSLMDAGRARLYNDIVQFANDNRIVLEGISATALKNLGISDPDRLNKPFGDGKPASRDSMSTEVRSLSIDSHTSSAIDSREPRRKSTDLLEKERDKRNDEKTALMICKSTEKYVNELKKLKTYELTQHLQHVNYNWLHELKEKIELLDRGLALLKPVKDNANKKSREKESLDAGLCLSKFNDLMHADLVRPTSRLAKKTNALFAGSPLEIFFAKDFSEGKKREAEFMDLIVKPLLKKWEDNKDLTKLTPEQREEIESSKEPSWLKREHKIGYYVYLSSVYLNYLQRNDSHSPETTALKIEIMKLALKKLGSPDNTDNPQERIDNFRATLLASLNDNEESILATRRDGPFMAFLRKIGVILGFKGKTKGLEFMETVGVTDFDLVGAKKTLADIRNPNAFSQEKDVRFSEERSVNAGTFFAPPK